MTLVNLAKTFKETIDCMAENDMIIELAVKQLGEEIENSHTLSKNRTKKIQISLDKALKLRKRIKIVQDTVTEKMIEQSENNQ